MTCLSLSFAPHPLLLMNRMNDNDYGHEHEARSWNLSYSALSRDQVLTVAINPVKYGHQQRCRDRLPGVTGIGNRSPRSTCRTSVWPFQTESERRLIYDAGAGRGAGRDVAHGRQLQHHPNDCYHGSERSGPGTADTLDPGGSSISWKHPSADGQTGDRDSQPLVHLQMKKGTVGIR